MKEVLEEILKELKQAKKDSLGTYRTGDYRIGLTKAESIVNDKLHIHVVVGRREQLKAEQEAYDIGYNEGAHAAAKEILNN